MSSLVGGSVLEGEFRSTYEGADKQAYLAALRSWLGECEWLDLWPGRDPGR